MIPSAPRLTLTISGLLLVSCLFSACPKPERTVPLVTGQTQAAAQAAIVAAGLRLGSVTQQASTTVAAGLVISQDPAAGARVADGSRVNLVVSSGPPCIDVPDLVGTAANAADATLTAAGLVLGTETEAPDDAVAEGNIISQNPLATACVAAGTAVDIVVSAGPAPIEISDLDELQKIGNDSAYPLDGNYQLTQDINATAKGAGTFTPIGDSEDPFTGHFDGQGFAIIGLVITLPGQDNVGLFGQAGEFGFSIFDAEIENLEISGGSISGRDQVGALCGNLAGGSITNCHSSAAVSGERSIGGLLGTTSGPVTDSSSSGDVTSTLVASNEGDGIGGLIGSNGSLVLRCTASGRVQGLIGVGGLLGGNGAGVVECTASGEVVSTSAYVGGLIGMNVSANNPEFPDGPSVSDCISSGNVTGGFEVGGLIGRNFDSAPIMRCWATGDTTATLFGGAGGLIGANRNSSVTQCVAEGTVLISSGAFGAGGLLGFNQVDELDTSEITQCYALGSVQAQDRVGGIVGDATLSGPIRECFAAGAIVSLGDAGGLVGIVNPGETPVFDSFWDTQTTGRAASPGGGTGATTAQMQQAATFTDAGWDFVDVWGIEEGVSYPFLQWQEETP